MHHPRANWYLGPQTPSWAAAANVLSSIAYDDEPFIVGDMLIEMIAATQQESHIQIVYQTEQKQV